MIDAVLVQRKVKFGTKIAVKTMVSVMVVVLAVALPQLVHLVAGASGGITWLPMYLPVVLGGALLGVWWGLAVGIASPVASYLFSSLLLGSPMPALARLPFMVFELAVFAVVAGLFSKKIAKNSIYAFPAVILAILCGRGAFILSAAIFESVSGLAVSLVWSQIQQGLLGAMAMIVILPLVIMLISKLTLRENNE